MLLNKWLERDVEEGLVFSFDSLISRNGETLVIVTLSNGERWAYLDQNSMLATGEVARQIS